MAKILVPIAILVIAYCSWTHGALWEELRPRANPFYQAKNVDDLLSRLFKSKAVPFDVHVEPYLAANRKNEVLIRSYDKINAKNETETWIRIVGSSGTAAAWGIHSYIKQELRGYITWDSLDIDLPKTLPKVDRYLRSNSKFQYYENVCTFGYTFAFWNWTQWESHIDWMALNGINLPLAFTGQEAIWSKVYKSFNVSEEGLNNFFTGPAFLPWNRMGNLDGFGGPLPENWHNFTIPLQRQILERMRGFGMIPIIPAFSGHVPRELIDLNPNTSHYNLQWHDFKPTKFLDPRTDLFQKIAKTFLHEYIEEFGTDHVYSCDLFNEMDPPVTDLKELAHISKSVYKGMSQVDPKAVWIMQGWMFSSLYWRNQQIKYFLSGVDKGSLIILDLDSTEQRIYKRTRSYFGHPFIFNNLFNFGGNIFMYGRIQVLNEELFEALNMPNSSMIGSGLTPEGLADNHLNVDLSIELAWRHEPVSNLTLWVSDYMTRRYGAYNQYANEAWNVIASTVLSANESTFPIGGTFLTTLPSLSEAPPVPYNKTGLYYAWDRMMLAAPQLGTNPSFRYDLIDVTRQSLENFLPLYHSKILKYFYRNDWTRLDRYSQRFDQVLRDLDQLLATDSRFMLGPWLEQAKSLGKTEMEKKLYEFNARNQITLWGPNGEIIDYAAKQWSGLMIDYYMTRWNMFWDALKGSIKKIEEFSEDRFKLHFMEIIGIPFVKGRNSYPTKPHEDTIAIAELVYSKWRNEIRPFLPVNSTGEDDEYFDMPVNFD